MNFTSGLFHPVVPEDLFGLGEGYSSKDMHQVADPIAGFFQVIKVCDCHWLESWFDQANPSD